MECVLVIIQYRLQINISGDTLCGYFSGWPQKWIAFMDDCDCVAVGVIGSRLKAGHCWNRLDVWYGGVEGAVC